MKKKSMTGCRFSTRFSVLHDSDPTRRRVVGYTEKGRVGTFRGRRRTCAGLTRLRADRLAKHWSDELLIINGSAAVRGTVNYSLVVVLSPRPSPAQIGFVKRTGDREDCEDINWNRNT